MGTTMEVIYEWDEPPGSAKKKQPTILYPPSARRSTREKALTGDLELMHVDDEYRLDKSDLSDKVVGFLNRIRSQFSDRVGDFITYQEILKFARDSNFYISPDYNKDLKFHPLITMFMQRIWRAGLIKKYRRGIWEGARLGKTTGMNHGVAYWIWQEPERR